jgi:hypothetical protein
MASAQHACPVGQWDDAAHTSRCYECGTRILTSFHQGDDRAGEVILEIARPSLAILRSWNRPGRDMDELRQEVAFRVLEAAIDNAEKYLAKLRGGVSLGSLLGSQVRYAALDVIGDLVAHEERHQPLEAHDGELMTFGRPDVDAITVPSSALYDAFEAITGLLESLPSSERGEFIVWFEEVRSGRARGAIAETARRVHGAADNSTRVSITRRMAKVRQRILEVFTESLQADANAILRVTTWWGILLDADLKPDSTEGGDK